MRVARTVRRFSEDEAIVDALFGDESAGIALLDSAGRLIRANRAFTSLARSKPGASAWPGLPEKVQRDLRHGVRDRAKLRLSADVQAGDVQAGAGRSWISLTLTPVEGGGALLRVSDRTHEQELEDQLAQAQRLQAVGELAGGIAHDFNNLLTAILGGVDDLLARTASPADHDDLEHVRASAERGAALVRQLLAFGRQQTLQPQVVAVNTAISDAASLLRRLLGSRILLTLDLEEPGRRVWIDPVQLDQVLVNLAVNARDAMPGGGTLGIASFHRLLLAPETCRGEVVPPGRYAAITVSDTGSGIPAELLPRIFEPFFTTRRDSGGTGLGLSTVHGIIRQSGGFLFVDSEPGRSTTFTILLPRHEAQLWQQEPKAAAAAARPLAGDGRTVLLVEDEAPVRRLAERALIAQGWRVLSAACGQEALEIANPGVGEPPALCCLVSDVIMPGLDGPSLLEALRRTRPELPAILVSGYADAGLRERLAGADIHFMPKPFAMRDLIAAVADHCPTSLPLEERGARV